MLSVTLSSEEKRGWFSAALFKKNAARFWPLWAAYAAVQFFALPMNILMASSNYGYRPKADLTALFRDWVYGATLSGAVIALAFGVLYAMALFSYLMDHRAVGMFHSLPIRREGLFITNYLLALCGFLIPSLVMAFIAVAAGGVLGVNLLTEIFLWLLVQVVVGMFFFSFAVCCAMFTGHILALPVFYGILNVLVAGLSALLDIAFSVLLLGYSADSLYEAKFTRWCTPVWNISHLIQSDEWAVDTAGVKQTLTGLTSALGYAIVLLAVFTSIALWVYHLRELERAGDLVTVGWVRPVFQYGLGACVGLTGGVALYERFFYNAPPALFILLAAVCAVIGAFAGRMLLKKSVKVIADGWKGPLALGACMLVLLFAVRMDFFGYQRLVPDPAKVKKVTLSGVRSSPQDDGRYASVTLKAPEDVQAVTDFHKALVADLGRLQRAEEENGYGGEHLDGDGYQTEYVGRVELRYLMEDGSTVWRKWAQVPFTALELEEEKSYTAQLEALINRPAVARESYFWFMDANRIEAVGGRLENVHRDGLEDTVAVDGPSAATAEMSAEDYAAWREKMGEENTDQNFTVEQARILWETVQRDMAAGRLGRRYLLDTRERYDNCYITDLELNILCTRISEDGQRDISTSTVTITLQESATETMKALRDMGYGDLLVKWEKGD